MFQTNQKPSGQDYTATVAFVVIAVAVSPALLLLSHPFGVMHVLAASVLSAVSLAVARNSWKHSELTIPTMESK